MTIQFEDILNALCPEVKLHLSNAFQKVYQVSGSAEARLTSEVLIAYGFDAKVYDENDLSSGNTITMLYITLSSAEDPQAEQKMADALAYAKSLKPIKQELDTLFVPSISPQFHAYSMTFSNTPGMPGKQIVIRITPPPPASTARPASVQTPSLPSSSTASKDELLQTIQALQEKLAMVGGGTQNAAYRPAYAKNPSNASVKANTPKKASMSKKAASKNYLTKLKAKHKKGEDEFKAGPDLMQTFTQKKRMKDVDVNSLKYRWMTYLKGNSANTAVAFFVMVIVPIVIMLTIWINMKTYFCPDFAVESSKKIKQPWFCHHDEEVDQDQQQ